MSKPVISASSQTQIPDVTFRIYQTIAEAMRANRPIIIIEYNCVVRDASPFVNTTAIVPQTPDRIPSDFHVPYGYIKL